LGSGRQQALGLPASHLTAANDSTASARQFQIQRIKHLITFYFTFVNTSQLRIGFIFFYCSYYTLYGREKKAEIDKFSTSAFGCLHKKYLNPGR
jgi:hypothetical protein